MKLGLNLGLHNNRKIINVISITDTYQAVLDYATTNGYTAPNTETQTLQNNLIATLEELNIINNLDYFYLFSNGGNDAFARINIANTSKHYCLKNGEILHDSKLGYGIDPGGSTGGYMNPQYINTIATDAIKGSQNDASYGMYITKLDTNKSITCHVSSVLGSNRYSILGNLDRFYGSIWTSDAADFVSATEDVGFWWLLRKNSTQAEAYKNNSLITTFAQNSSSWDNVGNTPRHIFFNSSLSNQNSSANKDVYIGLAYSGAGADISSNITAFNTAVQTYFTALNAL